MHVTIPVSPGELIDKITVLEIKAVEIVDEGKRENVQRELTLLMETEKALPDTDELRTLWSELRRVNKLIWDSENDLRAHWNDDALFMKATRDSHSQNDERARLKRAINELCGSSIMEEKSHPTYEHKS